MAVASTEHIRHAVISFRHLKKAFGPKVILRDVSFDVEDGEVFFIIGQSGAGKSVMIKHLIGLLAPDDGEIWLDGEEISKFSEKQMYDVRMKCAMVFQHSTLFDSMSCIDNVALPLRKHKKLTVKQARDEARERLAQVHMTRYADRYPSELGDGMQKRVAIARALTLQPRYVLFDEPTTSLDPVSARRVDALIRELSDTLGGDQHRGEPRSDEHLLHRGSDRDALPGVREEARHPGRVQGLGGSDHRSVHQRAGRRADRLSLTRRS